MRTPKILGFKSSSTKSWNKHLGYIRRQENTLTSFTMPKRIEKTLGVETTNYSVINNRVTGGYYADNRSDITEDFSRNSMDCFDKAIYVSNELIARKFVLAMNPKKDYDIHYKTDAELSYLESLEMYNRCRNCNAPIRTRNCTILGAAVIIGVIEKHTEVYFDAEKGGMKFRFVEKREVFGQKCGCMMKDVRKMERKSRRENARIM